MSLFLLIAILFITNFISFKNQTIFKDMCWLKLIFFYAIFCFNFVTFCDTKYEHFFFRISLLILYNSRKNLFRNCFVFICIVIIFDKNISRFANLYQHINYCQSVEIFHFDQKQHFLWRIVYFSSITMLLLFNLTLILWNFTIAFVLIVLQINYVTIVEIFFLLLLKFSFVKILCWWNINICFCVK